MMLYKYYIFNNNNNNKQKSIWRMGVQYDAMAMFIPHVQIYDNIVLH